MKLKDSYFEIKEKYKGYIIIMKSGSFYNILGEDSYIFKNIFGYKVNSFSDTVKVGFPISSLNKVINILDKLKINYIVYEGEIKLKARFQKNKYDVFLKEELSISERIERISLLLKEKKNDERIIEILDAIEEII